MSTNISWVVNPDGTQGECWNPVVGCSPAGPGCLHCYAEGLHTKRHKAYIKHGGINPKNGKSMAKQYAKPFSDVQCLDLRLDAPLHWKKPRTVFVNSVSDLFHEDVPDLFIVKVLGMIAECPQHTFTILTKRADRMRKFFAEACRPNDVWVRTSVGVSRDDNPWPLPNLYLGLSVSAQEDWDRQSADFLAVPGKKIISAEPLLSTLDLSSALWQRMDMDDVPGSVMNDCGCGNYFETRKALAGVICGGESGGKARPMHPDWARSLRDQCAAASVPFYFKQMRNERGKMVSLPELDGKLHDDLPWGPAND